MPTIYEEVLLPCSKATAFREIGSTDFMKKIDPNYGLSTQILFQNNRRIRSVSKVPGIGDVEIERLMLPELDAIITQRMPPLGPFVYQLSLQSFHDCQDGCLLKWTNEFELNEENKAKEAYICSRIRDNDHANLLKTQGYFVGAKEQSAPA